MKHLILFILLVVSGVGLAQEPVLTLAVTTRDDDSGKKLTGATVEVYQDGKLFATKSSDSRGKVPIIDLPLNHNYTVYIKKEGYVTKVATIDASHPNPEDLDPFIPFDMQTSLFEKVEGVDFAFLETTPMIKFSLDEIGYQIWDQAYTKEMLKKIDDLKEEMAEKKKEDEKKRADFDKYVANGNKSFSGEDYQDAADQYKMALDLFDDAEVQQKYDDALAKLKEQEDAEADQKAYDDKMAQALADYEAKSFESALALYKEASAMMPNEQKPKDKIAEIEDILAKEKENEKAYNKFMADGGDDLTGEKYDEAITNFEGALGVRPGDPDATAKLQEAKDKKQAKDDAEAEEKKLDEDYNNLMAEADAAFDSKDYTTARSKYEEAKGLKPTESKPQEQIDKIDQILADQEAEKAKDQEYQDKMAEAKKAYDEKSYQAALDLYVEASAMKPEESEPKAMIKEIDGILEKQKADEEAYSKFMADGNTDLTGANYDNAITNFEGALDLRPGDPDATTKLQEAKDKKQALLDEEANQKKLDEDYDKLMADAQVDFTNESYEDARSKYVEAQGLKPNESKPAEEIKKIDDILAKQKADQDAQDKLDTDYNNLMSEADGLFDGKEWIKAKAKYEEAHNLKKDEQRPLDRIDLCNQEIENDKLQAQRDADYQAAMDAGQKLLDDGKLDEAKSKYNEASGLKPNEQEPKDKINEIEQMLSNQANDAEKEENYNKAMAEGNSLKDNKDYVSALNSYNSALVYKPNDADALARIDEVNDLIAADQEARDQEEKFDEYVKKAEDALDATNYVDAKLNYNSALEIKEDPAIRTKLAEIDELMAKEQDQAQLDADYAATIEDANNLFAAEDYEAALLKYKEAEALKSNEQYPKEKISEINELLAEQKSNEEKDKEFADLVSAGDEFFENKEYSKALAQYKEAIKVKPDPTIDQKINDINLLIAEQNQNDENDKLYQSKLDEAKLEFDAKNWIAAKNLYQAASDMKPNEAFPKDQLSEIDRLMKEEADNANDQAYQDLLSKADGFRDAINYDEALKFYEQAKAMKPTDSYPQSEIDKINTIRENEANDVAEKDRLEKEYNDLLSKANAAYDSEDWAGALISYKEAIALRPTDSFVTGRINDINGKLSNLDEEAKKKADYDAFIAQGNEKFDAGEFLESVPFYEQALGVLPNEQYPKDKIAEAEKLAAENTVTEENANYNKIVNKANEYFDESNYPKAKNLYERAIGIKPSDQYVQDRINEIDQILADEAADDLRGEYDDLMLQADSQFEQGNWQEAKGFYEQAYAKIPEQRPVDQIAICEANMQVDSDSTIEKEYNKIITKANEYFDAANYPKAKNLYERAVNIKPSDQYPKDRLAEIDRILHPEKYESHRGELVDRGDPIDASGLDMEALLKEARAQKEFNDSQLTVRANEGIEKKTTEWTDDTSDDRFDTKLEVDSLNIDIEENIALGDEKRIESNKEVIIMEESLEEKQNQNQNNQTDENFITKDEVDELNIDIEENIALGDEKRTESNEEVIAMEESLDLTLREFGSMNENDVQQQNSVVTNLHTQIEERNEDDDLPREEYLADVETIQLEIKYENESNSNSQNNNNQGAKEDVEDLQLDHISNDPNNDIDRKNSEVLVEDFSITVLNKKNEDGWDQEDQVNNVVNQTELLTDERFAEDVGNDIPRIENVKDVDDLYTENSNINTSQSNDQYDATIDGKIYQENLVTEIQIENKNNDIPRQDMETHVEETEIELENNLESLTEDQNDILYESDADMDNLEVEIEDEFADKDDDRAEYEVVVEDLDLEIQDFKDDLTDDSEDNMHSTVDYAEDMTDNKLSFEKDSDDKINDVIDNTNEAVDGIVDENNQIGEENTEKRNETTDYIDSMQDINVNEIDPEMQNKIGKEFPEGVTEEVYEYKDADGLLEKFVVRRIVVINGVGYVYEKIQTRYGVTSYTKNGDGITEYQWDSETNNGDLTRN